MAEPPLHIAARRGLVDTLELMLKYHKAFPVDRENAKGQTAFLQAIHTDKRNFDADQTAQFIQVCKRLLEANANPNHTDRNGNCTLYLAINIHLNASGKVQLIDLLVKKGCGDFHLTTTNHNAFDLACYKGGKAALQALLNHNFFIQPWALETLCLGAVNSRLPPVIDLKQRMEMIQPLIQRGAALGALSQDSPKLLEILGSINRLGRDELHVAILRAFNEAQQQSLV